MAISSKPQDSDPIVEQQEGLSGVKFIQSPALIQFFNDLADAINSFDIDGLKQKIAEAEMFISLNKSQLLKEISNIESGAKLAYQLESDISSLRAKIPNIDGILSKLAELESENGQLRARIDKLEKVTKNLEQQSWL